MSGPFIVESEAKKGAPMKDRRAIDDLTQRQYEVIGLIVAGLANKQIARQLKITEGTVKVHLYNIYQKIGVRNRTELALLAHGTDGGVWR